MVKPYSEKLCRHIDITKHIYGARRIVVIPYIFQKQQIYQTVEIIVTQICRDRQL